MTVVKLNRRLALEAPDRQPDGGGGFIETWVTLGEVWAEVQPRSGRERAEPGAMVSAVSCRIIVRATPVGSASRPQPQQRFRDGARVYLIQAVTEQDGSGRYLMCFADEEVVA